MIEHKRRLSVGTMGFMWNDRRRNDQQWQMGLLRPKRFSVLKGEGISGFFAPSWLDEGERLSGSFMSRQKRWRSTHKFSVAASKRLIPDRRSDRGVAKLNRTILSTPKSSPGDRPNPNDSKYALGCSTGMELASIQAR